MIKLLALYANDDNGNCTKSRPTCPLKKGCEVVNKKGVFFSIFVTMRKVTKYSTVHTYQAARKLLMVLCGRKSRGTLEVVRKKSIGLSYPFFDLYEHRKINYPFVGK